MNEGQDPFGECGLHLAGEVELAVKGSQQLHRLKPPEIHSDVVAVAGKLVGQVFERMGKFFKPATRLGCNPATNSRLREKARSRVEWFHEGYGPIVKSGMLVIFHAVRMMRSFHKKSLLISNQGEGPGCVYGGKCPTLSAAYVTRLTNI